MQHLKVILMALLMSVSSVLPSYSMGDEHVIIILTEIKTGHGGGPRSGAPITAGIDDGVIITESSNYSGTITVTIQDEEGETVLSAVENVSTNSQFTTNVSSLPDGTYTIYYTLDDTVYYGEFEKN